MPEVNKKELWLQLDSYHFDHIVPTNVWNKIVELFGGEDASTKAFADKISRKHNWTSSFALHSIPTKEERPKRNNQHTVLRQYGTDALLLHQQVEILA